MQKGKKEKEKAGDVTTKVVLRVREIKVLEEKEEKRANKQG